MMNAMSDAFKKHMSKNKMHAPMEGSPEEEKGETKAEEDKEQAKGVGDHAPTREGQGYQTQAPPHNGAVVGPIHGDQMGGEVSHGGGLGPEHLEILAKLLSQHSHGGGAGFDAMGNNSVKEKMASIMQHRSDGKTGKY